MQSVTPSEMLSMYGLVLMVAGALAYTAAPETAKAMSSIYMGNGGALISFLLAFGVRNIAIKKGEPNFIIMMICIHLAFIFPVLFGGVVGWRLSLAWNNPAKAYLKPYFLVIIGMSLITAAFVYSQKPKRAPKDNIKTDTTTVTDETPESSKAAANTVRRRRRAAAM